MSLFGFPVFRYIDIDDAEGVLQAIRDTPDEWPIEIVLDPHSALGPVDPQLGQHPAASIVAVAARPGSHTDETLILADVARKALVQMEYFVRALLERRMPADGLASSLACFRPAPGHTTSR